MAQVAINSVTKNRPEEGKMMSIKIDLKIFLFGVLFLLTNQIEIYAILMIFALLHELGHLCAGLILDFKVRTIGINPFGFYIEFKTQVEDYKKVKKGNELCLKRLVIALAGPIINIFIAIVCIFIDTELAISRENIIYGNILLAIFNLIPIYPLDGGRVLKEIIHIFKGKEEAYKQIVQISKITVILLTILVSILILYIHNIAFLLILAYLWYLVWRNNKFYLQFK